MNAALGSNRVSLDVSAQLKYPGLVTCPHSGTFLFLTLHLLLRAPGNCPAFSKPTHRSAPAVDPPDRCLCIAETILIKQEHLHTLESPVSASVPPTPSRTLCFQRQRCPEPPRTCQASTLSSHQRHHPLSVYNDPLG